MYLGSWKIDDFVTFCVNTHDATGAEIDADSAPTYRVYEDETGVAILTGSMALLDDTNTLGYYSERIQLTAANGFEKGKSYNIRISATVGGVSGSTVRTLQLEAEVDANVVSDKTGYALTATPPTAVQIRDEIDANSIALDNLATMILDVPTAVENADTLLNTGGMYPSDTIGGEILGLASLEGLIANVESHVEEFRTRFNTMIVLDGAVYQFTGNALEFAPTGGSAPTAAQIRTEMDDNSTKLASIQTTVIANAAAIAAIPDPPTVEEIIDGILDEVLAGSHDVVGSPGALLQSAGAAGDPLIGVIEPANAGEGLAAVTLKQAIQMMASMLCGLTSGGKTSTLVFRDLNNSRNCLTFNVDAENDRTTVTRNVT
jgi:hypothetical protein